MQYYGATPASQWAGGYGYGYGDDYAPAPTSTLAETTSTGPIATAQGWWSSQSTTVKIAVGVGAAALVGWLLFSLVGSGQTATPNRRRRRRYKANRRLSTKRRQGAARKAVKSKIRGKRSRARRGSRITLASGKRFGHMIPPKRYYKMGAKKPSDYAYPEGYKYPLIFHKGSKINIAQTIKHIKNAKSRFAKDKRRYPMSVRREIARNINRANKRFHVGGKIVKP